MDAERTISPSRIGRRALLLASVLGFAGACAPKAPAPPPSPPPSSPPPSPAARADLPTSTTNPDLVRETSYGDSLRVGFCGAPRSPALGRMTGDLDAAGAALQRQLAAYGPETQPVVELIATAVQSAPGPDGMYRTRADDSTVQRYLDEARKLKGLLLVNIQPGHADFLDEVRAYERWLTEPDVGIALDPEWAVDPGVKPGQKYGHVDGAKLDEVSRFLSDLVTRHGIPTKMLAYHQVAASVVRSEDDLVPHPGVYPVKIVDGIGSRELKTETWNVVMRSKPGHVAAGFKLFYDEDTRKGGKLMQPDEVMALRPKPTYVVYE
ncbi:hypothetical protein FPZ12_020690 [Amycolatopsis acidicola]|uniref:Lipoprotein n=1 Tax=Amycolatopsis acidicola TaxID=2596893 RepID=A0A5N0V156_9PSEU|nr:hypothetical protein [Amycolatopsis acidicola]KAA9159322.1 hypothetical protein FPZ12_020690 [Amycolatopsis acidicola]